MTPFRSRVLAHLVWMAQRDKAYAWAASKHYAQLCPQELGDMPQLLTAAMRHKQQPTP